MQIYSNEIRTWSASINEDWNARQPTAEAVDRKHIGEGDCDEEVLNEAVEEAE